MQLRDFVGSIIKSLYASSTLQDCLNMDSDKLLQGFPYWGMGGSPPPPVENLLISLPSSSKFLFPLSKG